MLEMQRELNHCRAPPQPHLPLETDVTEPSSDWLRAGRGNLWTMKCLL